MKDIEFWSGAQLRISFDSPSNRFLGRDESRFRTIVFRILKVVFGNFKSGEDIPPAGERPIVPAHGRRASGALKRKLNLTIQMILWAGFLSALAASSPAGVYARDFRVEGAGVEASPTVHDGPCPGTIEFSAKIQASGAGRVKYTWLRSDGASGPVEQLDFTEAGIRRVTTTWTLGDSVALPAYSGWQQLKVLAPNEYLSNKAEFVLTCVATQMPPVESKADLVVGRASLKLGEICRERSPVLFAVVEVRNIGSAASAARSDVGLVGATDDAGTGWGNGVGLPSIGPGAAHVATIPIYYLIDNPTYMRGLHKFRIQVNSGLWIEETNTGNNHYEPVSIEIPDSFCGSK